MSINMDPNALNTGIQKLDVVNEKFNALKDKMNGIDLSGSGLKSASLFSEAKTIVNNLTAGASSASSINALSQKIKNIRNILIQNDAEMASLFGQFDGMSLEEFGDYADGIYNDGNTVYFDSSLFHDENFVSMIKDTINKALLEDDKDGKYVRYITSIELMEKGQAGFHTTEDTLYVKLSSGHKYYINIKGQVNSNSMVHVMHQGAYDGSAKKLDDLYKNHCSDVENGIFIRMVNACGTKGISEELDANTSVVKVISDTFSIPFNNTTIEGFSGAQATVMHIAADIARETGKAPAGVSLVECHTKPHPWNLDDVKALNDVNAVIYATYTNNSATKREFTSWGENYNDLKMVYINREIGGHESVYIDYLKSGMLGFLINKSQFPVENYTKSTIETYDVNTLSWVDYDMTSKKTNDVFVQLANNNYWSGMNSDIPMEPVVVPLVNVEDNTLNNNVFGMLYDQSQYTNVSYAGDTLASNGCGFFSVLSAVTAKTGYEFSQSEIEKMANDINEAAKNGKLSVVNNKGRMEYLLDNLSEQYGFTWSKGNTSNISSALMKGDAVISLTDSSTHFVAITGVLDNGNVIVNDSDGNSYRRDAVLRDRVDNVGFNLSNNELKVSNGDVWYLNFENSNKEINSVNDEIANLEKLNETVVSDVNMNLPYTEVPLYFQTDYPDVRYGKKESDTVASDGCGITSLAMVASYLTDKKILPDQLAVQFANKATGSGSCWTLFRDSQEPLGITLDEQTWSWDKAYDALKNGQVVIANAREQSVFTGGGHFIVLTGVTEDGKVLVNDPYKGNYERTDHKVLMDGFENGFDPNLFDNKGEMAQFWIYAPKDKKNVQSVEGNLETNFDENIESTISQDEEISKPPVQQEQVQKEEISKPLVQQEQVQKEEISKPLVQLDKVEDSDKFNNYVLNENYVDNIKNNNYSDSSNNNKLDVDMDLIDDNDYSVNNQNNFDELTINGVNSGDSSVEQDSLVDNNTGSINDVIGPNIDSKGEPKLGKYLVPGIIGTGLALVSAKIGGLIKKSKKNNDV